MAIAILISTFGCCNGLILSGARVYYAMAKDGLFFKSTGKVHPKYLTPKNALIVQGIWTCVLCLSGTYNDLLNYVIFAVLVFYILTIAGLFVLRRTKPEAERPYRAIGYPVLPAIYIVMALFIDVVLLRYKPQYTWPGLIIVLLGIPVYFVWSRRSARCTSLSTYKGETLHGQFIGDENRWTCCSPNRKRRKMSTALKRALGPINLITLGIGAIIGAGIFVLTGAAAAQFGGPAIVLSYILAGIGCVFAGFAMQNLPH